MRALITDLDNTLYDWVTYFASSFTAMVDVLARLLRVEHEILLDDYKRVHQRLGDSEVPFATLMLDTVRERFAGQDSAEIAAALQPAFRTFSREREQTLKLYDGVFATLAEISRKVPVIGHTEALVENANYRLHKLGIFSFFTRIYALSRPVPPRPFPLRYVIPESVLVRVPPHERKPNPRLLAHICASEGLDLSAAVYVGDSLTRDVAMARDAGVTSAWAEFGTHYSPTSWDTLVRVTHWTEEDVRREALLREKSRDIHPDHDLRSFPEILPVLAG